LSVKSYLKAVSIREKHNMITFHYCYKFRVWWKSPHSQDMMKI